MSATVHTAIRLAEQDRDEIKQLAEAHDLPFTRYMVDVALGRLPAAQSKTADRLDDLEQRLSRLEDLAF